MKIKNVSEEDLSRALQILNKKYENNIIWNNYQQLSEHTFRITLKVVSARKDGKGRKLNQSFLTYGKGIRANGSACWHVHGDFFDALLDINPNAVIETAWAIIDKNGGNWTDKNIGSLMNPLAYSECCECYLGLV